MKAIWLYSSEADAGGAAGQSVTIGRRSVTGWRKLVHDIIKVEFVGTIGRVHIMMAQVRTNRDIMKPLRELFYDQGNHYQFLSLSQELAAPGEMRQAQTFSFNFKNVEKQYEGYQSINVKLSNNSIKMEVGIEDCLHIEFEHNKSKYHLKDVIVGGIYFLLFRLKIKQIELAIILRETTGAVNTMKAKE
ncbi:hypothetical protein FRC00_007417 [Tulasnella sp. 408]|nr:hypothetical protein FRC00_007417 [Tulasnella sp. 408]